MGGRPHPQTNKPSSLQNFNKPVYKGGKGFYEGSTRDSNENRRENLDNTLFEDFDDEDLMMNPHEHLMNDSQRDSMIQDINMLDQYLKSVPLKMKRRNARASNKGNHGNYYY